MEKYRKLRTLIHKHDGHGGNYVDKNLYIEHLNKQIAYLETNINEDKHCRGIVKERYLALKEIRTIVMDTNIDMTELHNIYLEEFDKKNKTLDTNSIKETRDNKGVYVGSGGSNKNSIRYPKKTRSKKVWKIFYAMFPHKAKQDNFDGETSNRMKK
jgi:hypothetical protein